MQQLVDDPENDSHRHCKPHCTQYGDDELLMKFPAHIAPRLQLTCEQPNDLQ